MSVESYSLNKSLLAVKQVFFALDSHKEDHVAIHKKVITST